MENKLKSIITTERLIIFSLLLFLFIYFKGIFKQAQETVAKVEEKKNELIVDKNGNNHFRKEYQNNTSEIDLREVDSLKKVISNQKSEILAITKLNASIIDTLKTFKLEKDALNNKVWKFQKLYEDGTKSNITFNEADTTIISEADLKLYVTDYKEKIKGKTRFFVDVTSQNKNFKLNGSEVLRIPIKVQKDLFRVKWSSDYFKGINNDMNFITSDLKLLILPDNQIAPNIGTGFVWKFNDGTVFPFYKIGVDINLISVPK